ncbi:MAG: hypothetical protein QCH35_08015 [Methanomicrobiaceae archaeon]|nr:hypothetical protein [Methanomicrobiaceae archaeon]
MPDAHADKPEGRAYSTVGLALGVVSFVFLPIVFAPLAVIFGVIGVRKDDRNRGIAAVALGILAIAGFVAVNVL